MSAVIQKLFNDLIAYAQCCIKWVSVARFKLRACMQKLKRLCNVLVSHIPLSIFNRYCTFALEFFFLLRFRLSAMLWMAWQVNEEKILVFIADTFFKALTWSWFLFISLLNLTIALNETLYGVTNWIWELIWAWVINQIIIFSKN